MGSNACSISRIGGLVVAPALAGMKRDAMLAEGGRRDCRMVLKRAMGVRTTYGRQTRVYQA